MNDNLILRVKLNGKPGQSLPLLHGKHTGERKLRVRGTLIIEAGGCQEMPIDWCLPLDEPAVLEFNIEDCNKTPNPVEQVAMDIDIEANLSSGTKRRITLRIEREEAARLVVKLQAGFNLDPGACWAKYNRELENQLEVSELLSALSPEQVVQLSKCTGMTSEEIIKELKL